VTSFKFPAFHFTACSFIPSSSASSMPAASLARRTFKFMWMLSFLTVNNYPRDAMQQARTASARWGQPVDGFLSDRRDVRGRRSHISRGCTRAEEAGRVPSSPASPEREKEREREGLTWPRCHSRSRGTTSATCRLFTRGGVIIKGQPRGRSGRITIV